MVDIMVLVDCGMLFFSILLLCWAGDLAVHYTLEIATVYRMNKLFGGFVLLAISTGLPELSVAISSIYSGVVQVSVGDIIGSNVVDITLVLGVVALISGKIPVTKKNYSNIIMMLVIAMLAMVFVFSIGVITPVIGLFLMVVYGGCLAWIWRTGISCIAQAEKMKKAEFRHPDVPFVELVGKRVHHAFWSSKLGVIIKFLFSMALVLVSSRFAVIYAVKLCEGLGMSLETVGAAIIAVGTSLPELMLGLASVRRKEYCLALGNSLGSVLMQGTFILGLLGVMSPVKLKIYAVRSAMPFMFIAFATIGYGLIKRKKLDRIEGVILLATFVAFIIYQIMFIG